MISYLLPSGKSGTLSDPAILRVFYNRISWTLKDGSQESKQKFSMIRKLIAGFGQAGSTRKAMGESSGKGSTKKYIA
jgi:hypothetical protein